GVAVPHRAVANFLTSMAQEPGLGPQDKVLSVTTVMFDIAVLELFLPLVTGASVVIASSDAVREGFPLIERLERGDITLMQATPTLWDMLLDAGLAPGAGLVLLAGGEPLPADLARRLTSGGAVLWNMYGPTETTIWSAVCRV
ncbi:AMP-binding protein, partial [Thioclava sp. BHET1]